MILRSLQFMDYLPCLQAMRQFTALREPSTPDEIWLVEHPPVFTQGLAGKAEHVLTPGDIPVVATERGGQVTYHGPGQVLAYVLMDLRRARITVRHLVEQLEAAVIATLAEYGVAGMRRPGAPGVYLPQAQAPDTAGPKISALGVKVSRGCTYHGLALNVAMDLDPFGRINPCGYPGLEVIDLRQALMSQRGQDPVLQASAQVLVQDAAARLGRQLQTRLGAAPDV